MSLTTETHLVFHPHGEPEDFLSHKFLRMLSALGIVTILLSAYLTFHPTALSQITSWTGDESSKSSTIWGVFPWRIAAGWTVVQGITEFSTGSTPQLTDSFRIAALVSLLFMFVLVPCVFLFSWRGYHTHDHEQHTMEEELKSNPSAILPLAYGIGIALMVMLILPVLSLTLKGELDFRKMQRENDLSAQKDAMVSDVNTVFCDAYQYWILPESMQGGGRTFEHYQIPPPIRHNQGRTYSTIIATDNILKLQGYSGVGDGFLLATISSDGNLVFSTQGF